MNITSNVSISYSNIFDDYKTVKIKELLREIPTSNSLQIVGHFSAQIHTKERDNERQIEFLKVWLGRLPQNVHQKIGDFITILEIEGAKRFNFINNISNLILYENILENYNTLPPVKNLTPAQELNLFKAYLWCSNQWIDKQSINSGKVKTIDDIAELLIKIQFPYQELLELKNFRMQLIKAAYFFRFCEKNPVFKEFLAIFYKEHSVSSYEEYLKHILSVYIRKFDEFKTPSVLNVGREHIAVQQFLRQFCIDPKTFIKSDDFLSLREKPIYEISTNNFLFLNLNLLIDKLFQGVQFSFAKSLIKNKALYNGSEIKKFDHFKSIYGEELSEKGLFYSVMKFVFENQNYIKLDGQTLKMKIKEGEPDFYIRDGNKLFLFEYKDVIINAQVKHSYSFDTIKAELYKKFVSNQEGAGKGITQLINSVKKIKEGAYKDVDTLSNGLTFYPVIIFTDFVLNIAGVNYILNKEMRVQLQKSGADDKSIRNLVLIHLDDLIKFQDLFRDNQLNIGNCLDEFIKKTTGNPSTDNLMSFNNFIHNKTKNLKYTTPKLLFEIASGLLKE